MKLLDYVHPLQGTASAMTFSNGNTLALVARPFGMNAWSPQTNEAGGGWFFHPDDRHFQGLRLTHQPSPWIGDYGHLVLVPQTDALATCASRRASSFRSGDMVVKPDYFKVNLRRYDATLELTPTERCAVVLLRFGGAPAGARLLLASFEGESGFRIDPARRRVTGYTRASAGGTPPFFANYFVLEFDCDIDEAGSGTFEGAREDGAASALERSGERIGAYVGLQLPEDGTVTVRFGASFLGEEQAELNLRREVGGRSFDDVRAEAAAEWEARLGAVQVEDASLAVGAMPDTAEDRYRRLSTFYTCLYRNCLFPRRWYEFDASGERVHFSPYTGRKEAGVMYADNGFWDMFRTSYPLFSLLFPKELADMVEGWTNVYKQSGWLPRWSSPGERFAMPGTLIDMVFADAFVKGIRGFDAEAAYEGMRKHATQPPEPSALPGVPYGRQGLEAYERHGYLPIGSAHETVSNTLDYVYGDFCIAQFAKALGREEDYATFIRRAERYRLLFDENTGFMRARHEDGLWREPFDPVEWGNGYCESSAWQSSWAVQHDLLGLAALLGGREAFKAKLDELFATPPAFRVGSYGFEIHEMSEMAAVDFGQFAISNQPSFHLPYIYAALGFPERTRHWVHRTMEELFSHEPDGLPGDEDNGSMCAWYLFGALGFYPLTPGVPEYTFGSPLFARVRVRTENGKELVIISEGGARSETDGDEVFLNESKLGRLYVRHEELAAGRSLLFRRKPNAVRPEGEIEGLPYSLSTAAREAAR